MNVSLVVGQVRTFTIAILHPDLTPDNSFRGLAFPNRSNHAVADDGSSKARIEEGTISVKGERPSPIGPDGTPDTTTFVLVVETKNVSAQRIPVYLKDCVLNVRVLDPTASNFAYTEV